MMKLKLLTIFVLFALSSCSPVYIPNSPFVFNNDQKGDYSINFRQGAYSSNLQGGYAINDNLNAGVSVSALYSPATTGTFSTQGTEALDVGAVFGYYNKITSQNTFELNAGLGPIFYTQPSGISNYAKAFIQPSFTFSSKGNTRADFTLLVRGVGITFNDSRRGLDTTLTKAYIEPVMSLAIGNQIRFNTQFGLSVLTPEQYDGNYDPSPFIFNVGIGYTIPRNRKEATLP
jgi:hypothetical protein